MVKESDGPFPWQRSAKSVDEVAHNQKNKNLVQSSNCNLGNSFMYKNGPKWSACLKPSVLGQPGFLDMVHAALSIGCIDFRLPLSHVTAGGVLQHALKTIAGLFARNDPMIFKVGFSHDPVWRWSNPMYGYACSREKWTNMCVLYMSEEPYGPAMLEAALIQEHKSGLSIYVWKQF